MTAQDKPLSTPEELAAYRQAERRRAAERLASISPSDRHRLEWLVKTHREVHDGTIGGADERPEDRYPFKFGALSSAARAVLEMFDLDTDEPLELPCLTGSSEFFPTLRRLSRAQRDEVLRRLAVEQPTLLTRLIREIAPKALPERLRDGGAS